MNKMTWYLVVTESKNSAVTVQLLLDSEIGAEPCTQITITTTKLLANSKMEMMLFRYRLQTTKTKMMQIISSSSINKTLSWIYLK